MATAIFTGALVIALAINPLFFNVTQDISLGPNIHFGHLVTVVFFLAIVYDMDFMSTWRKKRKE